MRKQSINPIQWRFKNIECCIYNLLDLIIHSDEGHARLLDSKLRISHWWIQGTAHIFAKQIGLLFACVWFLFSLNFLTKFPCWIGHYNSNMWLEYGVLKANIITQLIQKQKHKGPDNQSKCVDIGFKYPYYL